MIYARSFATPLVVLILLASGAAADSLWLKDGSRLTGELVGIGDGTLSFRTRLAGKAYYRLDDVAGVSTDTFVIVALGDEVLLPGRLRYRDGANFVVSQNGQQERTITLTEVTRVATLPNARPEDEPVQDAGGERPLRAELEMGYRWRSGTVEYSGPFAELDVRGRTSTGELTGRVDAEYIGEGGSFDRYLKAEGRFRPDVLSTWKPEFSLQLTRDRDRALDYRAELTASLNRVFWESGNQELEAGVGLGGGIEEFDPEPLRRDQGLGIRRLLDGVTSDEELFGHLALRYTRLLFGQVSLEEAIVLRPSLSDLGDFRGEWESALLVPFSDRLRLKFNLVIDYDGDPKYRKIDEWRTSIGASVRVKF